jgi:hypothetical protein
VGVQCVDFSSACWEGQSHKPVLNPCRGLTVPWTILTRPEAGSRVEECGLGLRRAPKLFAPESSSQTSASSTRSPR